MLANLPNLLTIARLLLVPVVIWALLQDHDQLALSAFVFAGISDGADGFLARRYNLQSELGAYLDPLADKALLVSIFVTLAALHVVPTWLVILIATRDVLIVSAIVLARYLDRPLVIKPILVSKANTAAQIGLAGGILAFRAMGWTLSPFLEWAALAVAALTLCSLIAYMHLWLRHMNSGTRNKSG